MTPTNESPGVDVLAVMKVLSDCPLNLKQGANYELHMRACRAHDAVAALIAREAEQARRIAELEAEREALRVDAERLETLIAKEVIPHKMGDTGMYMLICADHCPYDGSEHDTPRAAIDAARAAAATPEGGAR